MRCRMVPIPWCTPCPEQETPTLWRGSAPYPSKLPRDHPPCGTPVPEGTLFVSECLCHNPPASATNSTRLALEPAGQDQGPPGAPVEGCADTAPALSSPDTAGWVPRGSAAAGWHHFDGAREIPLGAVSGDDGRRDGRDTEQAVSQGGLYLDTAETAGDPMTSRT
jgi:hypothetical protein